MGIPDMFLIFFTSGIEEVIQMCLVTLPFVTLTTKIIPRGNEATCYALVVSICALRQVEKILMGNLLNELFINLTADDLSNYWMAQLIASLSVVLAFIGIRLVP